MRQVFYRQFNNRQQVGSYVGLTPSHFQSGPSSRDQGISKAGNPKARTIMLELAWFWIRYQPNSCAYSKTHKCRKYRRLSAMSSQHICR
jgi:transposase